MGFDTFLEREALFTWAEWSGTGAVGLVASLTLQPWARRLDALIASNPDSVGHIVRVSMYQTGSDVTLGTVNIPAGAGTSAVPPYNVLDPVAPAYSGAIILPPEWGLGLELVDALVDPVVLQISIFGGIF